MTSIQLPNSALLMQEDRSTWPAVELDFKVLPPVHKRAAGRPRVQRIRSSFEKNATKKVKCKRCKGFGHFSKTCKFAEPGEEGPSKKR